MPKMVEHDCELCDVGADAGSGLGEEEPVRIPVLEGGQAVRGGQEGPVRLSLGAGRKEEAERIRLPFRKGGQAQVILSHLCLLGLG